MVANSTRLLILIIGVCSTFIAKAQSPYYHYFEDSIRPGYRVSGVLDSVDTKIAPYQHTLPTSFFNYGDFFFIQAINQNQLPTQPTRFSAIPHIGMVYAMGSNATQIGHLAYTQTIDSGFFVQLDYQRTTSNGALRNSNFENNCLDARFAIVRKRFATTAHIYFNGGNRAFNGGLLNDSLSNPDFDLIFQDVSKGNNQETSTFNKNTAGATFEVKRNFQVNSENYWSFVKYKSLKTGLFLHPSISIYNRKYVENAAIATIYGVVNYDSTETRDFYQVSQAQLAGGYFLHTQSVAWNVGMKGTYWDYDNLGHEHDTLELSILSTLNCSLKSGWKWKTNGGINVTGALGAFNGKTRLSKDFNLWELELYATINRSYPSPNQRYYFGNALNYAWNNQQFTTATEGGGKLRIRYKLGQLIVSGTFANYTKMPLFVDNHWRQDTLTSLSIVGLSAQTSIKIGSFFIQPTLILQQSTLSIVPKCSAFARLGFNGAIFKAKKLKTSLGVELGYISQFQLMDFVPQMGVYALTSTQKMFVAMPKWHTFASFDLGYFRWFVRGENMEQLFLKKVNMEALGYPVLPFQIRFGVSWDLFN